MRKEVVWAIAAGIIFGLVITFGIVRINSTLKPKGESVQVSPTPEGVLQEFKITLDKPEPEDVVMLSPIEVSGITKPLVWVTLSAEEGDYLIQSDGKGFFSESVTLISGVNQIKITAFDPSGSQSVEKVLVVYSSSFEKKETESRIEEARDKPKAYLGVVTDIADSTIQVKTSGGEIRQVATDKSEVTVVKTGKTNKVVGFGDIAIGDFIVALGYINGNQVLNAQRILITPPVTEPKITVAFGKGADITPTKTTRVLLFKDGKVTKAKTADIEDDSQIISITTEKDISPAQAGKSSLRTVFILPSQNLTE